MGSAGPPYQLAFRIEARDMAWWWLLVRRPRRVRLVAFAIVVLAAFVATLRRPISGTDIAVGLGLALLFALSPLIVAGVYYLLWFVTPGMRRDVTVTLNDNEVETGDRQASARFTWDAFDRLKSSRHMAVIGLRRGSGLMLPRRALDDTERWVAMLAFIEARLASAQTAERRPPGSM